MLNGVLGGSGFGFRVGLGSGLSKALPKTLPTIFLQFCAPWGSPILCRSKTYATHVQNAPRKIRHEFATNSP